MILIKQSLSLKRPEEPTINYSNKEISIKCTTKEYNKKRKNSTLTLKNSETTISYSKKSTIKWLISFLI